MPGPLKLPLLLAPGLLTVCCLAAAQKAPEPQPTAAPSATEQSEIPDVPGLSGALHGVNGGCTISSLHDSLTGWATLATPAIGYSFNDHFNIDVTATVYLYRLAQSRLSRPKPDAELVIQRAEVGDVIIGLHAGWSPRFADYQLTGSFTAPTGDATYGLSTGRVTFDVSNHFERTMGKLTPTLEIGMGDSSTLVNPLVTKNYTSLGPLAHFQTGLAFALPHNISFEADAYEQLPVGDQKTYGPARRGKGVVVIGHNVSEDNGFTTALDMPLDRHTTFSSYYNRSLRLHDDTVAVGLTYVLRSAPREQLPDSTLNDLFK